MYKALQLFAVSVLTAVILISNPKPEVESVSVSYNGIETVKMETTKTPPAVRKEIVLTKSKYSVSKQEQILQYVSRPKYSEEEIYLMAHLMIAEAESEGEDGQRLVIDSVLNRMDSCKFPDTPTDVIYQKNQYSATFDGRMERCEPTERAIELVKEEIRDRSNYDVIFFTAGQYSKYGEPLFKVGNHCFSKL